jgi:hypothetical protein
MICLIKRLEAEASKFDKRVVASLRNRYDFCAADTRDALLAAAKRIKELEAPSGAARLEIEERKLW